MCLRVKNILLLIVFLCIFTAISVLSLQKPFSPRYTQLRRYNVDPRLVSVSGLSNGAGFTVYMAFIYSSLISGVGVFAGAPYPVAHLVYSGQALNLFKIHYAYPAMEEWSRKGLIDPLTNLRRTRVYVFQGLKDILVPKYFNYDVVREFKYYGSAVKTSLQKVPTGHCLPTDNYPPQGDYFPLLGSASAVCNAGYQGVNHMFHHFYGPAFVWPQSNNATPTGQVFKFDQNEFTKNDYAEGALLAGAAFMYVPRACMWNHPCKLHLVFHGSSLPFFVRILSDGYNPLVHHAGYLQAADANNIIVLFPEVAALNIPSWDIFGITGKSFQWKNGTHPLAIAKMIKRVVYGH